VPNHVRNIIEAAPEVIRALLREPTKEERESAWDGPTDLIVDFALLIPTPDDYTTEGCSHQHGLSGLFGDAEDPNPSCWYVWNIRHWGTKWNAYSASWDAAEGDMATLEFDTAWSHPTPVIEALSLRFPDEKIDVRYADEDLGSNVGSYSIQNGEHYDVNQPEYGPESKEMAAQIKYGQSYKSLLEEWGEEDDDE
jgi:hypothetical protein